MAKNHVDFTLPEDVKLHVKEAISLHLKNNKHHPQAWEHIENMDEFHIKEMCCDLCAMAKELNNNPKDFFYKKLAQKYSFTKAQKQLVNRTLNILFPQEIKQKPKSNQR